MPDLNPSLSVCLSVCLQSSKSLQCTPVWSSSPRGKRAGNTSLPFPTQRSTILSEVHTDILQRAVSNLGPASRVPAQAGPKWTLGKGLTSCVPAQARLHATRGSLSDRRPPSPYCSWDGEGPLHRNTNSCSGDELTCAHKWKACFPGKKTKCETSCKIANTRRKRKVGFGVRQVV